MTHEFNSLLALTQAIPDEQAAIDHFTAIRWRNGAFCPHCGSTKVYNFSDKRTHKCGDCRKRFSIKVGTIFEDTKIPLRKWFMAIWFLTSHKKGIASTQLAKDIDVTQKTAWFMMHRLRAAATTKSFNSPLKGTVEVDETFVGGKARNRHVDKRGKSGVTGGTGKAIVAGAIERKGDVVARVVEDVKAVTLTGFIRQAVSRDVDLLVTDQWVGYKHVGREYPHAIVNHSQGVYVDGEAHTNSIESVWALFKRQIYGIHHVVSPKHLHRYLAEMTWRYNRREIGEGSRLNALIECADGRLTYKGLIA
jgi:transposase-like protein